MIVVMKTKIRML